MCSFEKDDLLIWVNLEGYEKKLMLRLKTNDDKKSYRDFFTIERALAFGQGAEILFEMPFKDIVDISYTRANGSEPYTICFYMLGGDPRLKEIKVEKHCFNYLAFKKMVKIYKKSGLRMSV